MTETYNVTLTYAIDDETRERVFRTTIEIEETAPFTDVSDAAYEELCDKHADAEEVNVLDEHIVGA